MAMIATESDALRLYRTTPAPGSAGSSQPDPGASLGGNRSSTLALRPGFIVRDPMPGIRIDDLVGPAGEATITADGDDSLHLTLPGEEAGEPVTLAPGQTRVLLGEGGHAVVTRAAELPGLPGVGGTMRIRLVPALSNELAMGEVDDASRQAGQIVHRAAMLHNVHPTDTLEDIRLWFTENPEDAFEMALEAPSNGAIQTIADEATAPTGLSWFAPSAPGSDLRIASLAAQGVYGLWFRRTTSAGAAASARQAAAIGLSFKTVVLT